MPDQVKPHEKTPPTDDERRKAAAEDSARSPTGNRGTQVHATAPNPPAKEPARGASRDESFEHAGRAVRAQPSTRKDPANRRETNIDEDTDASPSEDDQRDLKSDEEADPSDTTFPIDGRTERKPRAKGTADEEAD